METNDLLARISSDLGHLSDAISFGLNTLGERTSARTCDAITAFDEASAAVVQAVDSLAEQPAAHTRTDRAAREIARLDFAERHGEIEPPTFRPGWRPSMTAGWDWRHPLLGTHFTPPKP